MQFDKLKNHLTVLGRFLRIKITFVGNSDEDGEPKPRYYISLVNKPNHNFIVLWQSYQVEVSVGTVTKKVPLYFAETAFGLYAKGENNFTVLLGLTGLLKGRGKVSSEVFSKNFTSMVSYKLSDNQFEKAGELLKKAKEDAKKELIPFNSREFNCNIFANYFLTSLGIVIPELSMERIPSGIFNYTTKIPFKEEEIYCLEVGLYCSFDINTVEKPNVKRIYPSEFAKFFPDGQVTIKSAIEFLHDYSANTYKNSIFHPKRHYKDEVATLLLQIKEDPKKFHSIKDIIHFIDKNITPYRDPVGSLQTRLDYLTYLSTEDISLNNDAVPTQSKRQTL